MDTRVDRLIIHRRRLAFSFFTSAAALLCGCFYDPSLPDQSGFAELLPENFDRSALVRLYAGPFPPFPSFVSHFWFVVKSADSESFDRWEIWLQPGDPYGYVRRNLFEPEEGFGFGAFVIAERIGPDAESIVEFIETQSPLYPCRDFYALLPGPNSSTYVQWVLDHTGWYIELPPTAIGRDIPCDLP